MDQVHILQASLKGTGVREPGFLYGIDCRLDSLFPADHFYLLSVPITHDNPDEHYIRQTFSELAGCLSANIIIYDRKVKGQLINSLSCASGNSNH
jgi:hypothetical protein